MLFDPNVDPTLADVLGNQAQYKKNTITDQYVQNKRRLVGQQAAGGRLGSGVANYPLADFESGHGSDLAGVDTDLAAALGQIPAEDYLNQKNLQRNYALAQLVGSLNKKNGLQSGLAGAGAGAAAGSSFGPWGAAIGGVGGGLYGAFGD